VLSLKHSFEPAEGRVLLLRPGDQSIGEMVIDMGRLQNLRAPAPSHGGLILYLPGAGLDQSGVDGFVVDAVDDLVLLEDAEDLFGGVLDRDTAHARRHVVVGYLDAQRGGQQRGLQGLVIVIVPSTLLTTPGGTSPYWS